MYSWTAIICLSRQQYTYLKLSWWLVITCLSLITVHLFSWMAVNPWSHCAYLIFLRMMVNTCLLLTIQHLSHPLHQDSNQLPLMKMLCLSHLPKQDDSHTPLTVAVHLSHPLQIDQHHQNRYEHVMLSRETIMKSLRDLAGTISREKTTSCWT